LALMALLDLRLASWSQHHRYGSLNQADHCVDMAPYGRKTADDTKMATMKHSLFMLGAEQI
jgi:hypothetical protein